MPNLIDNLDYEFFQNISEEELRGMKFSVPWQIPMVDGEERYVDADGFDIRPQKGMEFTREQLQEQCWLKFQKNPQINTSVRGLMGRLTGLGFDTSSEIFEIQEAIDEIMYDPRNRLYNYMPKYVARSNVEGELFLCLTCHDDSFIEVDFIDPSSITGGGDDNSGIIFHPTKPLFPLFYNVESVVDPKTKEKSIVQIPSINIARYPGLARIPNLTGFDVNAQIQAKKVKRNPWMKLGGYYKFIVAWDKGFMTRRAVSYLRTTIEWLNHYENLKKYEIDHKKSAGSYLWVIEIEDARTFKIWLSLTPEERAKTGIMKKKTPGSTLVLPPGMKVTAVNPQLPKISDADTDLMEMVASGLNEPSDVLTGTAKGTYASVKASRGPMSDRTSDEIAYFDRFLKYDFWASIFFLKSQIGRFPSTFKKKEAVDFDDNQEPIFKKIPKKPEFLIDISYPISESSDTEAQARAFLGVKHGNMSESLGIPNSFMAKKIGIGCYGRRRLEKATEDDRYPQLLIEADAAAMGDGANPQDQKQEKKLASETKNVVQNKKIKSSGKK